MNTSAPVIHPQISRFHVIAKQLEQDLLRRWQEAARTMPTTIRERHLWWITDFDSLPPFLEAGMRARGGGPLIDHVRSAARNEGTIAAHATLVHEDLLIDHLRQKLPVREAYATIRAQVGHGIYRWVAFVGDGAAVGVCTATSQPNHEA